MYLLLHTVLSGEQAFHPYRAVPQGCLLENPKLGLSRRDRLIEKQWLEKSFHKLCVQNLHSRQLKKHLCTFIFKIKL